MTALRRRKVALISGRRRARGAGAAVDPLHYLRQALEPFAEVIEAPLAEMLIAAPDVLILADVAQRRPRPSAADSPGSRRAGCCCASPGRGWRPRGAGQLEDDPLLPVRLRAGGRSVGGAMSWGAPRRWRRSPKTRPFAGLPVPADVDDLARRCWRSPTRIWPSARSRALEDGTPLVTAQPLGDGQVVLFHVTANADWSSLPLSGLFVQMLERLALSAGGPAPKPPMLAGTTWTPQQVLDGFGDARGRRA